MLGLKILGTSAASPAYGRKPTAQVLQLPYAQILIDCGEGTQMQMMRYKTKMNKISMIFISHLHGDHYLGLIGLLSSMHLYQRQKGLKIFGPQGLKEILLVSFRHSNTRLSFPISFQTISGQGGELIFEDGQIEVETLKMNHRIPCNGFLFREKLKKRKIKIEALPKDTPPQYLSILQKGEDVRDESGNILLKASELTFRRPSHSFAHCSDTLYSESFLKQIEGVDLLYHESTFLHQDIAKAQATFHSTALQAASLAKKAQVKKLLIGHFSARYKDLSPLLEEAQSLFPNSFLAKEGESYDIYDKVEEDTSLI